jgi:hypothetical protein
MRETPLSATMAIIVSVTQQIARPSCLNAIMYFIEDRISIRLWTQRIRGV